MFFVYLFTKTQKLNQNVQEVKEMSQYFLSVIRTKNWKEAKEHLKRFYKTLTDTK